jgi:hypothetical protein
MSGATTRDEIIRVGNITEFGPESLALHKRPPAVR